MLTLAAVPPTYNFPRILGLANSNFASHRNFQKDELPCVVMNCYTIKVTIDIIMMPKCPPTEINRGHILMQLTISCDLHRDVNSGSHNMYVSNVHFD